MVIEWLIAVHHRSYSDPEALFLNVTIFNRLMDYEIVTIHNFPLYGLVCLMIASKFLDEHCPMGIWHCLYHCKSHGYN